MTRYMSSIAIAACLLLPVGAVLAQDQPTAASMLTGQSNPQADEQAAAEAAAAEEQAQAGKAAEAAAAEQQPAEAAPAGRRGERGCQDAQGNPREC